MNIKILLFVSTWIFAGFAAYSDETGRPFMTFYTSEQTGGHFQNWSFIQDDRGVMYIGNGYGVQEFDGSTWRLIPNSNGSFASCFTKDSTGRIYVGSAAEFGYLAPDEKGAMQYVSLVDQIPEADRGFTSINRIFALKEGVFFQSSQRMFLFTRIPVPAGQPEKWKVKVWRPENANTYFWFCQYLDKTLYVHHSTRGLLKMTGDSLQPVTRWKTLTNLRVRNILPFPGKKGSTLLVTTTGGLFTDDGNSLRAFPTEADDLFKGTLGDLKILDDGSIAIASLSNGLIIIDCNGKIKLNLTASNGLLSNVIRNIYIDRQGNLWLAMDGAIGILEFKSNQSSYRLSASGITDITRFQGTVYAATGTGIYYLDNRDDEFKALPETPRALFNYFCMDEGRLLNVCVSGIFEISLNRCKNLVSAQNQLVYLTTIHPFSADKLKFLVGTMGSFVVVKMDPLTRRLTLEKIIPEIYEYVNMIREPEPGVYWLGTYDAGTIRIRFENNDTGRAIVEKFGPGQGLPQGTVTVSIIPGRLVFSTNKGFYRFDESQKRFSPDTVFRDLKLGVNPSEYPVAADAQGNIWAFNGKRMVFYRLGQDGKYRMENGAYSRFGGQMVNVIYPEANGTTWFGLSGSIIRYKPSADTVAAPWSAMIRTVRFADETPLYLGGGKIVHAGVDNPQIPFSHNALSFEYTGLSYIKPEANEFQIRLDGYDLSWSAWSKDSKQNFTNLSPGTYTFRVKARNIIGQESKEASFAFTILAPWYLTWWAYLGYALLAGFAVYILVYYRTRKLKDRSLALEKIVEERTAEIQEQKNNVEQLSRIGRDITASLSIENIIKTAYENVNNLMDASVFTIGLHKSEENCIEFPATIEKGELLPAFSIPLTDENRLATWCFNHRQDVIINDYNEEYGRYINLRQKPVAGDHTESIVYLPLWNKEKEIGVISAQSFSKHAYTDYQVNILRNLATYSAIALENADSYRRLGALLDELKSTQDRLVTQSKLAALGALTAGIAHEIKNPLNFVNNFASMNAELVEELQEMMAEEKGNLDPEKLADIEEILITLKQNATKIQEHGKRADSIVRSMLQHSRSGSGERQPTDINAMLEEDLNLAYHGMRAQDKEFNIKIDTDLDRSLGKIEVIPQDISRVFLNIISNGFYETHRKKMDQEDGFSPTLSVRTRKLGDQVEIRIRDNGNGIPKAVREKLFTPFFTTKPAGQGTGLGLSISYDIVVHKHGGQISFETEEGSFTEFIILLPGNHMKNPG
ncbi:MAG: ATP-binding protein [Bacteroidia bacterium]|nr:ATP-binding protein [Bacteroidia bacterium]